MQALLKEYDEFTPCIWTTERDLIDRLNETYVRERGNPRPLKFQYYNTKHCTLVDSLTGNTKAVSLGDLDVSSIELGYMNYVCPNDNKKKVVYLQRDVRKQYRQGLCSSNVVSIPSDFARNWHFGHIQGFYDMVEGKYPSFSEALEELTKEVEGERAISRDIKIRREYSGVIMIYYMTKNVGWLAPESTKVRVMDTSMSWVIHRYLSRYGIQVENKKW